MLSRLGPLWGSFVHVDVDPTRSHMRCSDLIVMMAVSAIFVLGRGILYMSTCSLWTKSSKGAFVLISVCTFHRWWWLDHGNHPAQISLVIKHHCC